MSKRAITLTNSEISIVFWLISFIMFIFIFKTIYNFWTQVAHPITGNPGLAMEFSLLMFLLVIGIFFSLLAVILPNYLISKYNLNLFVDRISNPDYIGWIRFTRAKGLRPHIVKKGPLGVTRGFANNSPADCINNGDYTVTLQNGNQAIVKSDLLTQNVNLDECIGWQLVKKHFGVFGFNAWAKAADKDKLIFKRKNKGE